MAAIGSDATEDSGLFLEVANPREEGLCCHDSVPARVGAIVAVGNACDSDEGFGEGCGNSRFISLFSRASALGGTPFVLRGASSTAESRVSG